MIVKIIRGISSHSAKSLSYGVWRPTNGISININRKYGNCANSTIDPQDFYQVNKAVNWDPEGSKKVLYILKYIRVPYIRDRLVNIKPGEKYSTCLKGMKILDVGCGGGYLSEAFAKLGAEVTGIDTNQAGLDYAKKNSSKNIRLANNAPVYILSTIEEFCKNHAEIYDVVIAAEVLNHIARKELFVESCVRAAKPGAKLFFSTINRTLLSRFIVIFAYEYIFKAISKGVFQYDKFIKPNELKYMLEMNDCSVISIRGYTYFPFEKCWDWVNNEWFFNSIEALKAK